MIWLKAGYIFLEETIIILTRKNDNFYWNLSHTSKWYTPTPSHLLMGGAYPVING